VVREVLFQLVVGVLVAGVIASIAVLTKAWSWPNAAVGAVLLVCGVMYLMDRFGFGPSTKSRVRDWLDSSGFGVQTVEDTFEFHFVMTDPVGLRTDIFQAKTDSPVVIVSAKHVASKSQLDTFKTLSDADQKQFWKNVKLELLRYGVQFSNLNLNEPGTDFSDTFVVSRTSTGTEFLKRVLFVRSGARLYQELLLELAAGPGNEAIPEILR